MKKLLILTFLAPMFSFAQSILVSTAPENRSVLIEHFTGLNTGDGVLGYDAMNDVYTADPTRTSVICYHAGGFADPFGGQPDFRTTDGTTINNYFSVQQHPRGVIGRCPYQNQFAVHFDDYTTTSNIIRNMPSPVNLGMRSTWDAGTRDLSVDVEIYYTGNGSGGNDYISVALVESGLIGLQVDFNNPIGYDSTYAHPWVFREKLTNDVWGDEVMTNTTGHNETRTYTLSNVSTDYDITNCYVVAYIGELQNDVYQAKHVIADGGNTNVGITENELEAMVGFAYPSPAKDMLTIPFNDLGEDAVVRIADATGKLVSLENVRKGAANLRLDVSGWATGLYSYSVIGSNGSSTATRTVQVL